MGNKKSRFEAQEEEEEEVSSDSDLFILDQSNAASSSQDILHARRDSKGRNFINDYAVLKTIGKGSFGTVKLAQHVQSKQLFVRNYIIQKILS
jgi:serine/threonine protein kinase